MTESKKKVAYKDKLMDPRWQKKRLEIFNRDNWSCQKCGKKDSTLNAHHICYEAGIDPWEYDNFKIVTLCNSCHRIEHKAPIPVYDNRDGRIIKQISILNVMETEAYQCLTSTGFKIMSFLFSQVDFEMVEANKNEIRLLYSTLSKEPYLIPERSITRGIDELLAKGFITVIEQGGSKKGHASIYGLSEKYLDWKPGDEPIETRRPFSARGFCSKKQGD